VEPTLAALREGLGQRLVAVVLLGSHARAEATPESDWDLLILAKDLPESPFERSLFVKCLLPADCRGAISAFAKTPKEFEAYLSPLYLDIALDGKVLYDPHGYAAERLAALHHLINEAGLYREHTEAGDFWRWKKPPGGSWSLEWKK
jgi:hypothetical protein